MIDLLLKKFRHVHLIGIGGTGMSGIAEVLLRGGFDLTGSDLNESEATQRLRSLGATVWIGHSAGHLQGAEAVIYSSAVPDDHVELVEARRLNLPVVRRAEMLAELMRMKAGIAVSGSHGKTTTTSLVGEVLTAGGLEPTVIVGGRLKQIGSSTVLGSGDFLVAEADEFDQSFLKLTPVMVVVTNIGDDHLECYGSYAALQDAFMQFANSVPFYGRAVVCADEPSIQAVLPRLQRPVVTYGFASDADVQAVDASYSGSRSSFKIVTKRNGGSGGEVRLPLPGRHNVLNALAAAAVGLELGIPFDAIRAALEAFQGVHRRFELVGQVSGSRNQGIKGSSHSSRLKAHSSKLTAQSSQLTAQSSQLNDILVFDDFGHHPTEIKATLAAARSGWQRRIVAVFQPHLFSRTRDMAEGFGKALLGADLALVLPVYPARERPIEGVSSRLIVDAAIKQGHQHIEYLEDRALVADRVAELAKPGDMVLTIGAGDVFKLGPMVLEALKTSK